MNTISTSKTTRNILLCLLMCWLGVYASTLATIADKIAGRFARPATASGMFISAHAAGMFCSVLLSGTVADSFGKRRVVLIGAALAIFGLLLNAVSNSLWLTLLALFLTGAAFSPCEAIGSALLTDENPAQETRWMNISQIFFCAGAVVAPFAVSQYLSYAGRPYQTIFLFCAVLFAASAIAIYVTAGWQNPPVTQHERRQYNFFNVLKSRTVLLCALMVCLYLGYESVAPVYFKQLFGQRGMPEGMASLSISLFWLAMIVFRFIGTLMEGRELFSIRWFSWLAVAGCLLALAAGTDWLRLAGVVLFGFGCGPVWPMLFVLASKDIPGRSGAVFAVMMIFTTAGNTLFPLVIGNALANPAATIVCCALLALAVIALAWRLTHSKPAPTQLPAS